MSSEDPNNQPLPSAAEVAARRAAQVAADNPHGSPVPAPVPASPADGHETEPQDDAPPEDPYEPYRDLPLPTPMEVLELRRAADEGAKYLDALKRSKADFANLQKRSQRDQVQIREFARRDMILNYLDAIDEFRLSMDKAQEFSDFETFMNAMKIFEGKLDASMTRTGLTPIEAKGEPFNPDLHEAVMQLDNPAVAPGTVIEQVRSGYMLGDRLVRPAQVIVAKQPEAPAADVPAGDA